ncbi:ScyD/ScyE family protein [Nocardioides sp. W7]|uniref:ScyD/ScyE family protein n=1 Tax=Nocardioides sp. W7 TaxID=2931390 RepID=UPI001FD59C19|nr:ScyD/ScyE family protein [Nocardioides sp. W7]
MLSTLAPATAGGGHGGHHPGHSSGLQTVTALDGPRGVDALGDGRTLVAEGDGSFSLVVERRHKQALVIPLGSVAGGFPPAVAAGRHGTVYILTGAGGEPGGPPVPGAATLYKWRPGYAAPAFVADIAAYQAGDHDPYNQEGPAGESNPYGLAVLGNGAVLVADAAGNDVLKVSKNGRRITTVARLKPRTVPVPEGLPATDPEGQPTGFPPAGTPIPAEAVATSVAVGQDGSIYIGELRGFPATPGTSQIWRVRPGTTGAVCDPDAPYSGSCKRWADGQTSIVDLAVGKDDTVYALSLSKLSWFAFELGVPGAEVGALHALTRSWHGGVRAKELAPGMLITPGGVDVVDNTAYVTGPIFGPGSLSKLELGRKGHHHKGHHPR